MKNLLSQSTLLLLAASLFLVSCKGKRDKDKDNDIVVFAPNAIIPDYTSKALNTYQISDKSKVDESTALNNLRKLLDLMGIQKNFDLSNPVKESDCLFFLNNQDPSANCSINLKNGDISVNAGTKNYMNYGTTPDLLKQDAAQKMAQEYIQKLKYADFADPALALGHIGGVNMAAHDNQRPNQVYEKFTTVRYNRILDNVPVLGHSRLVVQLAEKGKLQGIIRQWAEFNGSPVQREAVVQQDEIKKSIANHLIGENKTAKKITVNQVNLVYYERKGIIEPALHIICQLQLPKSTTDSSLVNYPYDLVEPILKSPTILYTFMAESPKDQQPGNTDKANTNEPPKRGDDERN